MPNETVAGRIVCRVPVVFRLVASVRAEDGVFTAVCLNLPGICGQGDTEQEARDNFVAAASDIIAEYIKDSNCIPFLWKEE